MNKIQRFDLGEALTIAQVQEVHAGLGAVLEAAAGKAIELDASKLCKIDAAGVQLLTAFLRASASEQKKVALSKPTELLIQSFELLGLGNEINTYLEK